MGNTPSKGPPSGDPSSKLSIPTSEKRRRSSNNSEASSGKLSRELRQQQQQQQRQLTATPPGSQKPAKNTGSESKTSTDSPSSNPVPFSRPDQERSDPYHIPTPPGPPLNTYYGASEHLQRPPRLPLPIGDTTTAPGSPIIGPAGTNDADVPEDKPMDDHTEQNMSDLVGAAPGGGRASSSSINRAVPTTISWAGPGHKVYVTGTFVNWEKKFRLYRRYASLFLYNLIRTRKLMIDTGTTIIISCQLHYISVRERIT